MTAESQDAGACPVDHTTRQAWLEQARAAQQASSAAAASSACPVDHNTSPPPPSPPARPANHHHASPPKVCPVDHTASRPRSWTQAIASYIPFWSSQATAPTPKTPEAGQVRDGLGTERIVSSIPRSINTNPDSSPYPMEHGASANAEVESGTDHSGNWVYPSEKMFFEAMKRKGYEANTADMKTVVPIHNAVNERAWKEICDWEKPYLSESKCGGPKLESFANKMERMTPTARLNTILGYTAPFDRHDWVIDRCGTRVDYVIDFYSGRADGKPGPSFYLDVRPKLNTWEGVRMRAMKLTGLA